MKKVAIVGVEGSGKTVMLAGLGELYQHPDKDGYFLSPKNFSTAAYVAEKVAKLKAGEWPTATAEDVMQGLDWTLKKKQGDGVPASCCEVSFLDFPGEVYRKAFGADAETDEPGLSEEVEAMQDALLNYVRAADDVIVLVNLKDVISKGTHDLRVQESIWITKRILDYVLNTDDGRPASNAVIVLSQTDCYAETIRECGGAKGVLERYLPYVSGDYGWLDVLAVCAVDKTRLNDDGSLVPDAGFTFEGLRPIMDRIVSDNPGVRPRSEFQAWRVSGVLALMGGAVGVSWIGFRVWLKLWDLTHRAMETQSVARRLSDDLSQNLVFGLGALAVTFAGFLLSVNLKPGRRSQSLWRNRFFLGVLTLALSVSATLFWAFAVTFDGESARHMLEMQYSSFRMENLFGCIVSAMGALLTGALLAFGCAAGARRKS